MFIEELRKRSQDCPNSEIARGLYSFAEKIAKETTEHSKRILIQLPEFDLHDSVHLTAVLDNLEKIIGQAHLSRLSIYELFFLFSSSYLHDVGMALPDWETKILDLVEKQDEDWKMDFASKIGSPFSIAQAQDLISRHSEKIYGLFNTAKEWFFSPDTERELVDYLASVMLSYQKFRSGFTSKLNSIAGCELEAFVRFLRIDFIRMSHHERSRSFIRNLSSRLPSEIIPPWGEAIANDLAEICKSHGESCDFIEQMETEAQYIGPETANLQFVALLLRIADIIHFSFDRSPSVLSSEMQFVNMESFSHWAVKQQGVNYNISETGSMGKKEIKFRAYCKEPAYYYSLQRSLDWVDSELNNYVKVLRNWELTIETTKVEKWKIPLSPKVDRSGIIYDSKNFTPVPGLSFSLDQRRILELLMGVRLYKDKFACLRELYQNSLDACRCMIVLSDGEKQGKIEFWIESQKNSQASFLCCMDNGIGMTKEIIVNHFLKIGNSFYNSPEFERLRFTHKNRFTPISQFGVGILSCFMLGTKIDITTKPMPEISETTSPIRFSIDGVHENFYYAAPDPVDLERIGKHGTIVRIQLQEPSLVKAYNDKRLWFRHLSVRIAPDFKRVSQDLFSDWDSHIHYIVSKFVSLPQPNVEVHIRFEDGTTEPIVRWDEPVSLKDQRISEVDFLSLAEFYQKNQLYQAVNRRNRRVKNEVIFSKVDVQGLEFTWNLTLPSNSVEDPETTMVPESTFLGSPSLAIDGLNIAHNVGLGWESNLAWLCSFGYLNFTGEIRPILSVDRTSITNWPTPIQDLIDELGKKVLKETLKVTKEHCKKVGLEWHSTSALEVWESLFQLFSPFLPDLVEALIKDEDCFEIGLPEIGFLINTNPLSLKQFIDCNQFVIPKMNFSKLSSTAKLLILGKCSHSKQLKIGAEGIIVSEGVFTPVAPNKNFRHVDLYELLVKADEWAGCFSEYDLVTDYWPIIPARLFNRLIRTSNEEVAVNISSLERVLEIHKVANGITALGSQDPCQVHPRYGLYKAESMFSQDSKKSDGKIFKFEQVANNHWLFEINDYGPEAESSEKYYVLFIFVSPRLLSPEEKLDLKRAEIEEPEYAKGVKEGWSILFLGRKHSFPIILSGIVKREEMVQAIDSSIWDKLKIENYFFLDGTKVADLRKSKK